MEKEASMLRREALLGLPVLDQTSGRSLGAVTEVHIGGTPPRLQALRVGSRVLPFEGIASIRRDAIIAASDALQPKKPLPESVPEWRGKQVMKWNGQSLGTVSDVMIDPPSGQITGLELSQSFVDDLVAGRRYLPLLPTYPVQGDRLMISEEEAESIEPGAGGIKNLFGSKLK